MRSSNRDDILRLAPLALGFVAVAGLFLVQDFLGATLETLMWRLPGADKTLHCLAFFGIFVVLHWLAGHSAVGRAHRFAVAAGATLLLAAADEIQQGFAPHRSVELADFVADVGGLVLGAMFVRSDWRRGMRLGFSAAILLAVAAVAFDSYEERKDFNRGQFLERQGRFGPARQAYLRALEAGLTNAALYNSLGWLEIESGEGTADKALEYAGKALALEPGDPDILDTYGWALHHTGRHEEALEQLLRAYAKEPRMYCVHYHLAAVYLALHRPGDAERHFRTQIEVAPEVLETARSKEALQLLRGLR